MQAVSPRFMEAVIPVLLQIENEMKKQREDSEVVAALPKKCFDEALMTAFKSVWKIEFCKLK